MQRGETCHNINTTYKTFAPLCLLPVKDHQSYCFSFFLFCFACQYVEDVGVGLTPPPIPQPCCLSDQIIMRMVV